MLFKYIRMNEHNPQNINEEETLQENEEMQVSTTSQQEIHHHYKNDNDIDKNGIIHALINLLSMSLTDHFWGTVTFFSIIGIFYGIYHDKISLGGLVLSNVGISNTFILLGIIGLLGLSIFLVNNMISLTKDNSLTRSINKITIDECKSIKVELKQFNGVLTSLHNMHEDLNNAVNRLADLIANNNINTQKIRQELNTINNVIHKIPNRDAIINMLTIRTKVLFKDISEVISEYMSIMNTTDSSINASKNHFIEETLKNRFNNIINLFINDIYSYSKNTLDVNIKDRIQTLLTETFNDILQLILEPEYSTEQLFFIILKKVNELSSSLSNIYNDNLILTSFFNQVENE